MSGGRCWSSIVATPTERAALRLGPDAEWLVCCVLAEGHPGAHASDGAQPHFGRRRWLVWGDFARGAQMLRDEDPCPLVEIDGATCLFYLGHSGAHRYRSGVEVGAAPSAEEQPYLGSHLDRRPAGASAAVTPNWGAPDETLSAFDADPEPPTVEFAPIPTPPGWPHVGAINEMNQLFDGMPTLNPDDAPLPTNTGADWTVDLTVPLTEPAVEDADVVDVEEVSVENIVRDPTPVTELIEPDIPVVSAGSAEGVVAQHAEPAPEVADGPVVSGPAQFVPADDQSGKKQKHKRKKITNEFSPSLDENAPGGETAVVFRDDPDAALMEVRPSSSDVLTTSILQVIASNADPLRTGVPTTVRRASVVEPRAELVVEAPSSGGDNLDSDELRAMTVSVREAAKRLVDEADSEDARALSEALREVAVALADLTARLPR